VQFERTRLASGYDIEPTIFTDREVSEIVAFFQALTGTQPIKGRLGRPALVFSGLEVN
jgi:cytochrome c peroxidase